MHESRPCLVNQTSASTAEAQAIQVALRETKFGVDDKTIGDLDLVAMLDVHLERCAHQATSSCVEQSRLHEYPSVIEMPKLGEVGLARCLRIPAASS